jgi:hypothetical protein
MTAGKKQEHAQGQALAAGWDRQHADHGQRQACARYLAIAGRRSDFPPATSPVRHIQWQSKEGRGLPLVSNSPMSHSSGDNEAIGHN